MPTDPAAIRHLAQLWAAHPSGLLDQGAIEHIGRYLATDVAPAADGWHREAQRQAERIRAVLALTAPEESDAAREARVRRVCLQAEFFAADEAEAQAERTRRAKVIPIDAAQRAAEPAPLPVEKLSAVLLRVQEQIEHPVPAIATPFPHLNHLLLGGFRAGELVYVGARPGQGKSALALEVLRHAARHGHATLFVSREMSLEALSRRLIAQDGRLDAASLRTGKRIDWVRVTETIERLYALPVHLTQAARTIAEIHGAAQQVPDLALIVVDYLQLLAAPREIRDRRLQVEYLSAKLKAMAVHLSVPVVVLSSLARPEQRSSGKAPGLAALRDSGQLEHDADIVILLHRQSESVQTECIVAKSRDAMTGVVDLIFHPESVAFDEAMSAEEEKRYGN